MSWSLCRRDFVITLTCFFIYFQPSVTTDEIDKAVHQMIIDAGAYPSPLGYGGFPKSVCTSVNECMCHGIPDSRQLQVLTPQPLKPYDTLLLVYWVLFWISSLMIILFTGWRHYKHRRNCLLKCMYSSRCSFSGIFKSIKVNKNSSSSVLFLGCGITLAVFAVGELLNPIFW